MDSTVKLYPYQLDAIQAIEADHRSLQRTMLVIPTGTGKTMVAATYAKRGYLDQGRSVVWIAHSRELLDQARATFLRLGVDKNLIGRHYAEYKDLTNGVNARLWFVSNLVKYAPSESPSLVIIDEAHHAAAGTYTDWLSHFRTFRHDGPKVLGMTATPYRLHEGAVESLLSFSFSKPRVPIFENVAYQRSFCEMISLGRVAPFRRVRIDTKLAFPMQIANGDFTGASLGQLNSPQRNKIIVKEWAENRARYGKTIVFVGTVDHAQQLARDFKGAAECVHGGMDASDRAAAIARFRSGEKQVLVNVKVFGEGFDVPDIQSVFLARPTTSPMLFTQMVGRGSRILPSKRFFYLVDFHDQLGKHEAYLAGLADLTNRHEGQLIEVEKRAQAEEAVCGTSFGGLGRDTRVLADLAGLDVHRLLQEFAGWIAFEDSTGQPKPVASLLTKEQLAILQPLCDDGVIDMKDADALRQHQGDPAILKCMRAMSEGLIGRVYEFAPGQTDEIETIQQAGIIARGIGEIVSVEATNDFRRRLEDLGREWGVPESNIGAAFDEYARNPTACGGAMKLTGSNGAFLRMLPEAAIEVVAGAIRIHSTGEMTLTGAMEAQMHLEQLEPDLAPFTAAVMMQIIKGCHEADVIVRCPAVSVVNETASPGASALN